MTAEAPSPEDLATIGLSRDAIKDLNERCKGAMDDVLVAAFLIKLSAHEKWGPAIEGKKITREGIRILEIEGKLDLDPKRLSRIAEDVGAQYFT